MSAQSATVIGNRKLSLVICYDDSCAENGVSSGV